MYETYFAHHGVKGQKWGVIRKRKKALTTTDPKVLNKYSKYLTNQELNDRTNRLKIEQQAKALIPKPQSKQKKQHKKITLVGVLAQAGAAAGSLNKIAQAWNGDLGKIIRGVNKNGSSKLSDHVSTDDVVNKCMAAIGPKLKQCWKMTMSELQKQNAQRSQESRNDNVIYQPSVNYPQIQSYPIVPRS